MRVTWYLTAALLSLYPFAAMAAPAPAASFPPLDNWKAAVAAGDSASLAKLYSVQPPAQAYVAKQPVPALADELSYWAGLKSSGITSVNPKILSMTNVQGQERLVLRVSAVAGSDASVGGSHPLVASMMQIWLRQPDGWHLALSNRYDFQADAGRRLPEPAKPNPSLYPPPSEAQPELKEALARAGREHKRVLAIFGGNWCYDCHVLDTTFRSKDFASLLSANYVVIHVNIGEEGKDNNDLAARLGVNLERGVPSLAVLEPDGHVLVAQQNGEFQSTVRIGPNDVRSFLLQWAPAHKTT